MGIEIQVSSLEDLCTLMCDNKIPKYRSRSDSGKNIKNTISSNHNYSYSNQFTTDDDAIDIWDTNNISV